MADDLTLPLLLQDLLRRWRVVVTVAVAILGGAALYAESLPNEYEGRAILSFAPRVGVSNVGADTVRVVLPKYVAYVTAPATIRRIAPEIGERSSVLGPAVDASIASDSGNLTITVELTGASRAANAANALAEDTVSFADTDPLLQAIIVSPAVAPSSPSGPPRRLIEAAALALGLLVGAALAFVVERGRPRLRTWREVGVVTGYPVVGRIPPSRAFRGSPVEALADPAVGAAVRSLRTNLDRMSRERPVAVLVVTSSVPGEGKTTVASTLAVTLARLDAEVLLVDADLRRPGISRVFGIVPSPGLASVMRDEATLDASVRRGPVAGLRILPTEPDPDAGDLLARRFLDVIKAVRERHDVVVVDAPPLLGGDDAATLATLCDGVLLVASADTLAHSVSEAATALDALGVRVLGAVANRARDPRGLGTYGAYGAYGSYPAAPS